MDLDSRADSVPAESPRWAPGTAAAAAAATANDAVTLGAFLPGVQQAIKAVP